MADIKASAASRCNRSHPLSPHQRRARRQAEAIERQEQYDSLSLEEKIDKFAHAIWEHGGNGERQTQKLIEQGVNEEVLATALGCSVVD